MEQFYSSDWIGSRWIIFDFHKGSTRFSDIPNLPACYVAYLHDQIVYIGQTTGLRHRLTAGHRLRYSTASNAIHSTWGVPTVHLKIKARFGTRYGDWAMRELRLIARLRPPLNCVGSVKPRGRKAA